MVRPPHLKLQAALGNWILRVVLQNSIQQEEPQNSTQQEELEKSKREAGRRNSTPQQKLLGC
jgi:hypothetical protein